MVKQIQWGERSQRSRHALRIVKNGQTEEKLKWVIPTKNFSSSTTFRNSSNSAHRLDGSSITSIRWIFMLFAQMKRKQSWEGAEGHVTIPKQLVPDTFLSPSFGIPVFAEETEKVVVKPCACCRAIVSIAKIYDWGLWHVWKGYSEAGCEICKGQAGEGISDSCLGMYEGWLQSSDKTKNVTTGISLVMLFELFFPFFLSIFFFL